MDEFLGFLWKRACVERSKLHSKRQTQARSILLFSLLAGLIFVTLDRGFLPLGTIDPFGGRNEADIAGIEDVAIADALEIKLQGFVPGHRRVAWHRRIDNHEAV